MMMINNMIATRSEWSVVICFFVLFAVSGPGRAEEWYVSTTGDNNNSGTTGADSFGTVQKALDSAQDGDVIIMAPGFYSKEGNSNLDISISLRIVCHAEGDNAAAIFLEGATFAHVNLQLGHVVEFYGLLLSGGRPAIDVTGSKSDFVDLDEFFACTNCTIVDSEDTSVLLTSGKSKFIDCMFSGNQWGLELAGSSSAIVTESYFVESGSSQYSSGGAIYGNFDGDLTVEATYFGGNQGSTGQAINLSRLRGGSVTYSISNCAFIGNRGNNGVVAISAGSGSFTDVLFEGNSNHPNSNMGATIYLRDQSSVIMRRVRVQNNTDSNAIITDTVDVDFKMYESYIEGRFLAGGSTFIEFGQESAALLALDCRDIVSLTSKFGTEVHLDRLSGYDADVDLDFNVSANSISMQGTSVTGTGLSASVLSAADTSLYSSSYSVRSMEFSNCHIIVPEDGTSVLKNSVSMEPTPGGDGTVFTNYGTLRLQSEDPNGYDEVSVKLGAEGRLINYGVVKLHASSDFEGILELAPYSVWNITIYGYNLRRSVVSYISGRLSIAGDLRSRLAWNDLDLTVFSLDANAAYEGQFTTFGSYADDEEDDLQMSVEYGPEAVVAKFRIHMSTTLLVIIVVGSLLGVGIVIMSLFGVYYLVTRRNSDAGGAFENWGKADEQPLLSNDD